MEMDEAWGDQRGSRAQTDLNLCCSTSVCLDLNIYKGIKRAFSDRELRQGLQEKMLGVQQDRVNFIWVHTENHKEFDILYQSTGGH